MKTDYMKYSVTTRYGARQVATLREARRLRRDEHADGWPSRIVRLTDGAVVS